MLLSDDVYLLQILSLLQHKRKHIGLGGSKNELFQVIKMDFMFFAKHQN